MINEIIYEYLNDFIITYLDDIMIYFKTLKEHKKHIKKILKQLQEKNLLLKLKKCEFHKQKVEYLEHIVISEELQMNSEKIKAILKYSTLKNVKEILAFQSLAEYY